LLAVGRRHQILTLTFNTKFGNSQVQNASFCSLEGAQSSVQQITYRPSHGDLSPDPLTVTCHQTLLSDINSAPQLFSNPAAELRSPSIVFRFPSPNSL